MKPILFILPDTPIPERNPEPVKTRLNLARVLANKDGSPVLGIRTIIPEKPAGSVYAHSNLPTTRQVARGGPTKGTATSRGATRDEGRV